MRTSIQDGALIQLNQFIDRAEKSPRKLTEELAADFRGAVLMAWALYPTAVMASSVDPAAYALGGGTFPETEADAVSLALYNCYATTEYRPFVGDDLVSDATAPSNITEGGLIQVTQWLDKAERAHKRMSADMATDFRKMILAARVADPMADWFSLIDPAIYVLGGGTWPQTSADALEDALNACGSFSVPYAF